MSLTSLTLTNFRRHENTHIDFSGDAQIIAVTGRNGMGKSTLLTEALLWALYGESRHGRRQLAGMVRRGAEHEGMQVELAFQMNGTTYRVVRRWEKNKHSAQLFANEALLVQTADGVTAEITRIFGMDVVGFKLATITKQKELDGLTDLTPANRQKVLTRLLRLDAVQAAARQANAQFRQKRDVARALDGGPSVTDCRAALERELQTSTESDAALAQARAALAALDAQLEASSSVETDYNAAMIAVSAAQATAAAAAGERDRVDAELAGVTVPQALPKPALSAEDVNAQLSVVDALIARGEAAATIAQQARHTARELERVTARIAEIETALGGASADELTTQLRAAEATLAQAGTERQELAQRREDLLAEHGQLQGRISDLQDRLATEGDLGAVCDTCEQEIPEAHKHAQHERRTAELEQLRSTALTVVSRGQGLKSEIATIDERAAAAQRTVRDLGTQLVRVEALSRELAESQRRKATYEEQLERLVVEEIDLDAAYARKGTLECARTEADTFARNVSAREAALTRLEDLRAKSAAAAARHTEAVAAAEAAAPSPDLVQAHHDRQELLTRREEERGLVEACAAEAAAASERVHGARRALVEAEKADEKVQRYRSDALVASKTSQLLDAVSQRMATQIRPALEGQISSVLQTISEGRFTSVKVSDDYEVTVADSDGRFYPVTEYSGGEADLISLAIRLALAQVVAARHGAGQHSFLVLDEVFGSQDTSRRLAILEGLRRLRSTYGQILLVSHVGGIEEAADTVLEVTPDEEDPQIARVRVS